MSSWTDKPVDTVVIGLGNPLMGDDGLGIAALHALRDRWQFNPPVELVDGGTWGMKVLPSIEDAARVLLLDAINANAEPGSVVVLERERLPMWFAAKISPHQIDMKEVLALAELRGTLPHTTVAIGLQPDTIELSAELSPCLSNRLDDLTAVVVQRLEEWGHVAFPQVPVADA